MLTHEEIVKKLGFDPLDRSVPDRISPTCEDDLTPSPYSVLNEEELDFIADELFEAKKQGRLPPYPKEN